MGDAGCDDADLQARVLDLRQDESSSRLGRPTIR